MAASRQQLKLVEDVQMDLGPTFFVRESFSFSPPNLPLRRVLVTVKEKLAQAWRQVDLVKIIFVSGLTLINNRRKGAYGPELHVKQLVPH